MPDLKLALVGSMALDDPEDWEVYRQIKEAAREDPDIDIFTNLTGISNVEVNAGSCRRARQLANGPAQAEWCARNCARSASVAVVGVDAYRENLRKASRRAPDNALYIVANALALPRELGGMASKVTLSRRGDPARLTLARFRCSSGGAEQRGATLTQACLRLHRESPD